MSKQVEHTRGHWDIMRDGPLQDGAPWIARNEAAAGLTIGCAEHTEPIARVFGYLHPVDANARLIAAAPDLLAACEASAEFLSKHCGCDECCAQMLALKTAIAKARSTP